MPTDTTRHLHNQKNNRFKSKNLQQSGLLSNNIKMNAPIYLKAFEFEKMG